MKFKKRDKLETVTVNNYPNMNCLNVLLFLSVFSPVQRINYLQWRVCKAGFDKSDFYHCSCLISSEYRRK